VLKASFDKSRNAEKARVKEEEEKLAAQWAKVKWLIYTTVYFGGDT